MAFGEILLAGNFCLRLHLARSGSQSQRAIWLILPARGASHIIRHHIASSGVITNKKGKFCKKKAQGYLINVNLFHPALIEQNPMGSLKPLGLVFLLISFW